ncbi:hypothetical protein UIB01_01790 [Stutzerimonas decontaminans]|uniref:Uncharacterized protein n=1 Tax=Stutzerimonas stutzeri TaxID=316 RepID=A0A023WYR3_STUST|nr:hypothetical protein UIB01_01790 [Stutzerimonas decontaminans]
MLTSHGALQQALDGVSQLAVADGIAGAEEYRIALDRLADDSGGQAADVLRRRNRHGGLPAAECANDVVVQIDHAEGRLEQEAGEHAGGDDLPLKAGLSTQHVTHVQLIIEQRLRASSADGVIVDAELPRDIALHCRLQRRLGQFALDAGPRGEAEAADQRVETT